MWKSKSTLERQLESERNLNKKLTEQLKTVTDMLEHQLKENDDQQRLLNTYHNCCTKMIENHVKGHIHTLENMVRAVQCSWIFRELDENGKTLDYDLEERSFNFIKDRLTKEMISCQQNKKWSRQLLDYVRGSVLKEVEDAK